MTLAVAVPLGVAALAGTRRGSLRARLAWAGVMAYLVYIYLEMAVAPPFTALYLVYVVTLATAIPAVLMAMSSLDTNALTAAIGHGAPRRGMAAFSFAFAAGLEPWRATSAGLRV